MTQVARTVRCLALTVAAIFAIGLSGCEMFDGDDNDNDRTPSERREPLTVSGVPKSAELLREGSGELSARASSDGKAYLYDVNDGRVVWSGNVQRGELITIDPDNDRAAVEGKVVFDQNLERRHSHRIYLDPR
ncbi:hypothetical protein [Fontivita pretiosa]|jgi:hypothetical protein|uniref:hypothetical protein n=1 Tax=Fontivita pretiosa TaxID=2989684 RepID=UPI003D16F8B0